MMTSDKEKLAAISLGDVVTWMEDHREVSGLVDGFRLPSHPDENSSHSIIIGRPGEKQVTIALSAILSRSRESIADRGFVSWNES